MCLSGWKESLFLNWSIHGLATEISSLSVCPEVIGAQTAHCCICLANCFNLFGHSLWPVLHVLPSLYLKSPQRLFRLLLSAASIMDRLASTLVTPTLCVSSVLSPYIHFHLFHPACALLFPLCCALFILLDGWPHVLNTYSLQLHLPTCFPLIHTRLLSRLYWYSLFFSPAHSSASSGSHLPAPYFH